MANIIMLAIGLRLALKLIPIDKPSGTSKMSHIIATGIFITADLKTVIVK